MFAMYYVDDSGLLCAITDVAYVRAVGACSEIVASSTFAEQNN